jgi:AbiV family abortive infection protein
VKPLPANELTRARATILVNAGALLDDARVLLNEKSYARGFALTVLAREELGKLAMIVRAWYAVEAGEGFNWDRLERRMLQHDAKLATFALLQTMNSTSLFGHPDPKGELLRLLDDPKYRRMLNEGKQDGFYVSVSDDGVKAPLELISASMAEGLHDTTKTMQMFFISGEEEDPTMSFFAGIQDLYGKMICLAEDLIADPSGVSLPR